MRYQAGLGLHVALVDKLQTRRPADGDSDSQSDGSYGPYGPDGEEEVENRTVSCKFTGVLDE